MDVRDAGPTDAAGIAAIYNDAVTRTTAIWNETTVDTPDRERWIAGRRAAGFPVLVAIDDAGEVVGYASFGDWRPFDGYRHTVEHSVYVRADQRGKGLGTTLLTALILRARRAGKRVMVAGIEARNGGSVRLHEKLGFEHAGTLRQVGAKFDTWLDLTFMQLTLDARERPSGRP